jgi:hypothetical protein
LSVFISQQVRMMVAEANLVRARAERPDRVGFSMAPVPTNHVPVRADMRIVDVSSDSDNEVWLVDPRDPESRQRQPLDVSFEDDDDDDDDDGVELLQ